MSNEAAQIISGRRKAVNRAFHILCLATTSLALIVLAILIAHVTFQGFDYLSFDFLTNWGSRFPDKAGIKAGLIGTLWLIGFTALFSVPIGVAAAIYLEEYAPRNWVTRIIQVNIANLAGVPSIVYGILGLALFARWLREYTNGQSVISGALTMSLLVLPVIILASRESVRAVPDSLRQGAYALGATKWQTVFHHVLPNAIPGIMTGIILAISRAIGETAPLIVLGVPVVISFTPQDPTSKFTALPMLIFDWANRPQAEFHNVAAAAIIVLLVVLLFMNAAAVFIRHRTQRKHD